MQQSGSNFETLQNGNIESANSATYAAGQYAYCNVTSCSTPAGWSQQTQLTRLTSTTCRAVELLNITVKKEGTKTARSASYWQAGENKEITGWMHRLPNSEAIPQVACYKYLGGEEKAQWKVQAVQL